MRTVALALLLSGAASFFAGPRPEVQRASVRLFGRVKKGGLKKQIAGLQKPKDPESFLKDPAGDVESNGASSTGMSDEEIAEQLKGPASLDTVLPAEVAAGRRVLDPVSKMPVYLPQEEDTRMALCFPRGAKALRESARLSWSSATTYEEVRAGLLAACKAGNETMRDFVLANYDHLGVDVALLLTGLRMNALFRKSKGEAAELTEARDLFLKAEQILGTPFRQIMKEAELRVGASVNDFKALEKMASTLPASEASASWLLIKAAVATWEDKFVFDQRRLARLQAAETQDLDKVREAETEVQKTAANMDVWQRMAQAYTSSEAALAKLRPEMRFLDKAFNLASPQEVRDYAAKDFAGSDAAGGLSEADLRERVRQLRVLLQRLSATNYGALLFKVEELSQVLAAGTPDEVNYYAAAREAGACFFETYEMPENELSALRNWESERTSGVEKRDSKATSPLEKPKRPEGLDWYDSPVEVEEIPEFQRSSLDDTAIDPESWDSTIKIRKMEKAARAEVEAGGKPMFPSEDDLLHLLGGDVGVYQRVLDDLLEDLDVRSAVNLPNLSPKDIKEAMEEIEGMLAEAEAEGSLAEEEEESEEQLRARVKADFEARVAATDAAMEGVYTSDSRARIQKFLDTYQTQEAVSEE